MPLALWYSKESLTPLRTGEVGNKPYSYLKQLYGGIVLIIKDGVVRVMEGETA